MVEQPLRRLSFAVQLRRLHDALAATPIDGHYWVWAGLLLGWAREGRILRHDYRDADFAYLAEDQPRFIESAPSLIKAGFRPQHRLRNNAGRTTVWTFRRAGADFEFFRIERSGPSFGYYGYDGFDSARKRIEMYCEVPAQPLVTFSFLGRTWLKVLDHEREFESLYGDWRTPGPGPRLGEAPAVVRCTTWRPSEHGWTGDFSGD